MFPPSIIRTLELGFWPNPFPAEAHNPKYRSICKVDRKFLDHAIDFKELSEGKTGEKRQANKQSCSYACIWNFMNNDRCGKYGNLAKDQYSLRVFQAGHERNSQCSKNDEHHS